MPVWLILATAAAIAATALLTLLLYRINSGPGGAAAGRDGKSSDPGPIYGDSGGSRRADHDTDASDGGGGDGGGGDGGGE